MLDLPSRRIWLGAVIGLIVLWPRVPSRAASVGVRAPEPLAVRGIAGHSIAHALVDLQEIAAEAAAAREGKGRIAPGGYA